MTLPSRMAALEITDEGLVLRNDYPVPEVRPGEALVRVLLAGVCSTDLHLLEGYKGGYRGIPGHEFVGKVAVAPDQADRIGQRVVGEINIGCGVCDLCRQGLGTHCIRRESLGIMGRDGAFAEYLALPLSNLHVVPEHITDEEAVFTEPLAAALQLLEQVSVAPTARVYVLGDGRLGLLVAQVLARTGAELTAIGRNDNKLAILAGQGLATARSDREGQLERLLAEPADVVVEVTGSPSGFSLARRLVRPGGLIALKSTFAGGLDDFDISSLVVDEITLLGSRCGPFAPALRLLADSAVSVTPLISCRYRLADGVSALAQAGCKGVIKVLIEP